MPNARAETSIAQRHVNWSWISLVELMLESVGDSGTPRYPMCGAYLGEMRPEGGRMATSNDLQGALPHDRVSYPGAAQHMTAISHTKEALPLILLC